MPHYVVTSPILTFLDALVGHVESLWLPAGSDEVARIYDTALNTTNVAGLVGRKVWFLPADYDDQPATRGEDEASYRVNVFVVERYPDALPVPVEWVDERVDWVHDRVLDWLEFTGRDDDPLFAISGRRVWTQFREPVEVYDPRILSQHGVFWSSLEFTFREIV